MTSRRRAILWLSLSLVILALGANLVRLSSEARETASPQPYTVVLRETAFSRTGEAKPGGTYTLAVRSDGATLLQSEVLVGPEPSSERTLAFATGLRIQVDDIRELKSTTFNTERRPSYRDPRADCLWNPGGERSYTGEVLAGRESVDAFRTVVIRAQGLTTWFALDVGCAPLKKRLGPEASPTNLKNYQSIRAGEPSVALFEVPAAYREVSPTEFYRLKQGEPYAKRAEDYYRTHRPSVDQTSR